MSADVRVSTINQCPACHLPRATSMLQRNFLGPGRSVPCRHCGVRLTVSSSPMLAWFALLTAAGIVNIFFIKNPDCAASITLMALLLAEWIWFVAPLILWTPEHAAKFSIRPLVPVKALVGGVLGVGFGLAACYATSLQQHAVPIVIAALILGPILFSLIPNWRTLFFFSVGVVLCTSGLVVMGKYREARFVAETFEHIKEHIEALHR